MAESDKQKTAFTCRYGTYQFTVMPFGLMTAPSTVQRMMPSVFFYLLDEGVLCYLDDLLIYSKTVKEHKILQIKFLLYLIKTSFLLRKASAICSYSV